MRLQPESVASVVRRSVDVEAIAEHVEEEIGRELREPEYSALQTAVTEAATEALGELVLADE